MSPPESLERRVERALKDAGPDGLSLVELRHALGDEPERNELRSVLKKLARAGRAAALGRDHYAAPTTQADLVGRLRFRAGRYVVEAAGESYTISPEQLDDHIAGDVVRVTATGEQSRGHARAIIVDAVKSAPRETFGLIQKKGRYLIANSAEIDEPILVVDERAKVGGGDLRIVGRAARRRRVIAGLPICPLIAELAPATSRVQEKVVPRERDDEPTRVTAREAYRFVQRDEYNVDVLLDQLAKGMGVDRDFSVEALAVAERAEPVSGLREGDVDLRDEALVTIDGETAKDFDDAVAATRLDSGEIEVLVAIADVSFYVPTDSALDVEAKERGSSVYLPGRVYPMLPERLSNHLCSLVPDEDRYCSWVRMRIGKDGATSWYDLGFGVMRSQARLTYTQVQAHFDGEAPIEDPRIAESIDALHEAYERLHNRRVRRGMLDFSLPEAVIMRSEDGTDVEGITLHPRWTSHRLIEECMLATNETVADYLARDNWPAIYRSHDEPDEDKLDSAFKFAATLGVNVQRVQGRRTIDDIMALVRALEDNSAARVGNFMILRSMKKASYSVSTDGHFGIGATRYSHFTSPIRRYADLEIHRVLREALATERAAPGQARRLKARLQDGARAANEGELRADSAERYAERLLKARFMNDRVGDVFDVIVTGVQNFGLFVSIAEQNIEGLVLINSLPGRDHYEMSPEQDELRGQRTGRRFRLGQALRVQCVRVRVHEAQVNFEVVPDEFQQPAKDDRPIALDQDLILGPDDSLPYDDFDGP